MDNRRLEIHNKLKQDICNYVDIESDEYRNLLQQMELSRVGRGLLRRKKTLHDKFEALETCGQLTVGDYGFLKKIVKDSGNAGDLMTFIHGAEAEFRKLDTTVDTPIQETPEPPRKIARVSSNESNEADNLYDGEFYHTDGKKGLLLILSANHQAVQGDATSLRTFFGGELGFDVEEPKESFTKSELEKYLKQQGQRLTSKYYCFICVVLSHGTRKNIVLSDKSEIPLDDIRKIFDNQNTPTFTGRPKLFFIQACQGTGAQGFNQVDEADDHVTPVIDEDDILVTIPNDADVLIAYATTPDYKVHSDFLHGKSLFIEKLVESFRTRYKTTHVEDMFITVREQVALRSKETYDSDEEFLCMMKTMPCTWSSLRKPLFLVKYEPGANMKYLSSEIRGRIHKAT